MELGKAAFAQMMRPTDDRLLAAQIPHITSSNIAVEVELSADDPTRSATASAMWAAWPNSISAHSGPWFRRSGSSRRSPWRPAGRTEARSRSTAPRRTAMNPEAVHHPEPTAPLALVFGAVVFRGWMLPLSRLWTMHAGVCRGGAGDRVRSRSGWVLRNGDTGRRRVVRGWLGLVLALAVEPLGAVDALEPRSRRPFAPSDPPCAEADQPMRRGCALLPPDEMLLGSTPDIPTYNESLELLEETVTGALCLEHANFKIWLSTTEGVLAQGVLRSERRRLSDRPTIRTPRPARSTPP